MTQATVTYLHQMTPRRAAAMRELRRAIEIPSGRKTYGRKRKVLPTFCEAVIGDGALLLIVTPVRNAPDYHVVAVDSSWARPGAYAHIGIEADLDGEDRRDMVSDLLRDVCGDGDLWYEENGDEGVLPHRLFAGDMGFYYAIERPSTTEAMLLGTE